MSESMPVDLRRRLRDLRILPDVPGFGATWVAAGASDGGDGATHTNLAREAAA